MDDVDVDESAVSSRLYYYDLSFSARLEEKSGYDRIHGGDSFSGS